MFFDLTSKAKRIKKAVENNTYPPAFSAKEWRNVKANCYSYVLDIPISDFFGKKIWIPGVMSGFNTEELIWSSLHLIDCVKSDLDFLGFNYRKDDGTALKETEYRIAMYILPSLHDCPHDFHFVRQDSDGEWSERNGYQNVPRKFEEVTDTPPDLEMYGPRLCEVFVISKK